jgi:hypothetical protein
VIEVMLIVVHPSPYRDLTGNEKKCPRSIMCISLTPQKTHLMKNYV